MLFEVDFRVLFWGGGFFKGERRWGLKENEDKNIMSKIQKKMKKYHGKNESPFQKIQATSHIMVKPTNQKFFLNDNRVSVKDVTNSTRSLVVYANDAGPVNLLGHTSLLDVFLKNFADADDKDFSGEKVVELLKVYFFTERLILGDGWDGEILHRWWKLYIDITSFINVEEQIQISPHSPEISKRRSKLRICRTTSFRI